MRFYFTILLVLFAGLPRSPAAMEEELQFAGKLTAEGFPRLARTVLTRTVRDFPEAEKEAPELRIRILIAEKRFDEAQAAIAPPNDSPLLWLFLADTAYRARKTATAESAYKKYFSSGAAADDATIQAAFNYGELLEERNERAVAAKLYEQVLKGSGNEPGRAEKDFAPVWQRPPGLIKAARPVKAKLAHLLADGESPKPADLDRAKKLCEEVQLGGLDLWFGQSVVTWSKVMQLKGDWDETTAVLETQLELLKQLETALEKQGQPVSLISPLAGARYLLGTCYEHADKKEAALTQFYNVYAKYGDSEWGPKAQERARTLITEFEGRGKTVKIDLGVNQTRMEESRFRVARRHFFEKQYAAALPAYLDALNKYPESNEAVTALRELMLCYIQLNDPRGAKAIVAYVGERFGKRDVAAEALLAAGKCALDEKQNKLAWWIYDRYFASFPNHSRAPGVLYSLAALHKQTGDAKGEEDCLNRLLQNYPADSYATRALGRLAWNACEKENYATAAIRFEQVVKNETDPEKLLRARFALAEAYRFTAASSTDSNDWKKALGKFQTLEESLNTAVERFGVSEEMRVLGGSFLEKSIFYQGTCLAKLGELDAAVQVFDRFLQTFPESEFAPQTRLAQGAALVTLKRYDAALTALVGFSETSDANYMESVFYFRGQAFFETGHYAQSIQSLETLLTRWPESAFYFETRLVQGRAYAATGQNTEAVRALSDILNFATDDLLVHRASLELGRVQTDPAEKLASFQRVALLADAAKSEQAALIQQALTESLPLYLALNRPQDVLTDSDRLVKEFPMSGKTAELNSWRVKAGEQLVQNNRTADNAN